MPVMKEGKDLLSAALAIAPPNKAPQYGQEYG